VKKKTQTKGY